MGNAYCRMLGKRKRRLLLNKLVLDGLYSAGKTTILYRLKLGEFVETMHSSDVNIERLEYKNMNFVAWDLGGRHKIRALWKLNYRGAFAFFFVVDSSDKERMEEAKEELHRAVREDELKDCIVVVLANKQDLNDALKPDEIEEKMDLKTVRKTHTCEVFGTTGTTGEGLYEMLDWLSCAVAKKSALKALLGKEELSKDPPKIESKSTYFTAPFLYLKDVFSKV